MNLCRSIAISLTKVMHTAANRSPTDSKQVGYSVVDASLYNAMANRFSRGMHNR